MERVIKLVGMAADICKVWAASTLPIYSYSIFARTASVPTPSLTSADKSANSRWIKGYQQYMMNVRQIQITTGRRIMKRLFSPRQARGQSIIRGGAVAVTGFLQARRFVSALIAQVKMAAHTTFMKKKIESFTVEMLITRDPDPTGRPSTSFLVSCIWCLLGAKREGSSLWSPPKKNKIN